jgi:SAM-dependent methyltransferase
MWDDSRAALADLELGDRERVLDVGCGTGELTRVLAAESDAEVVGVDADPDLLAAAAHRPVVRGDATRLPFGDDAVDLVVCQALLINLPDPAAAIEEFARVSTDLVAAVEPDNSRVAVTSTVDGEAELTARARAAYLDGVATDPTLGGAPTRTLFEDTGLTDVATRRYDHEQVVAAPYDDDDLAAARRKATGEALADKRETLLAGGLDEERYEQLRQDWRSMGRQAVEQMQAGEYRRTETIPFFVTVGRV